MYGGRWTKGLPEFIYFITDGSGENNWIMGSYIHPQSGRNNRKFKLVEVSMEEKKKKK